MNKKIKSTTLIAEIKKKLGPVYQDPQLCEQYAWWTTEHITGRTQTELLSAAELELTEKQKNRLFHWLDALINTQMPIQYLIGSVPFNELEILVKEPVLIPRPETEEWVLTLINRLKELKNKKLHILDLCTGSGCIALALAKALPEADILATDISEKAVMLAQKNSAHNNIKNITITLSDLFEKISTTNYFDIIVCNPPYIAPEEWRTLDRSVAEWEDKQALVAEKKGYAIIEKIISHAPAYLHTNSEMAKQKMPQLLIEIGHAQGKAVVDLMQKAGYTHIQVHKDLARKDRVVSGRVDNVATAQNT